MGGPLCRATTPPCGGPSTGASSCYRGTPDKRFLDLRPLAQHFVPGSSPRRFSAEAPLRRLFVNDCRVVYTEFGSGWSDSRCAGRRDAPLRDRTVSSPVFSLLICGRADSRSKSQTTQGLNKPTQGTYSARSPTRRTGRDFTGCSAERTASRRFCGNARASAAQLLRID